MHRYHRVEKAVDYTRRIFLQKSGFLLLSSTASVMMPGMAMASWKLVLPMPKRPPMPIKPRPSWPRVAIVIDDIGNNLHLAREFLALPVPITFSILPQRPFSRRLMEEIAKAGHEILLHQPMEPFRRDIDPGPGAVYTSFSSTRIQETIRTNLMEINLATGVNNHMGSKFTANGKKIKEALEVIKQKGLFFVDSLTTPRSVAYRTARRLHIIAAHRNVFLDCPAHTTVAIKEMKKLMSVAIRWGKAIGIGHPFATTLQGIKVFLSTYQSIWKRVEFVGISKLMHNCGYELHKNHKE